MAETQSDSPEHPAQEYNPRGESPISSQGTDGPVVSVPTQPPVLGPEAARALLHLLIAAHRRHTHTNPAGEEP